jgi:hypothetical protein
MDNIREISTLIPLILASDSIQTPQLSIAVELFNYGDSCSSKLSITETALSYTNRTTNMLFNSSSSNMICQITAEYSNVQINTTSFIDISLNEQFSYAAFIHVSVSSPSAVPNYNSSLSFFISTDDNSKVFKGSQPTILALRVTPCVKIT